MSIPESDNPDGTTPRRRRFQFSLGTLLLSMTVVGLTVALVISNRRLEESQRELDTLRPISVQEVARQFKSNTTVGPIVTTVLDVRYSQQKDAYRVDFSWLDPNTGNNWSTSATLESDGFGQYTGTIRNSEFIQLLGRNNVFHVLVESPSNFTE